MDAKFESQINGCWLGKAIGGTLGAPHEGKKGPLNLSFYDPVPTGILPNDDLDLQIVWLHHLLETRAGEVTPSLLSKAWNRYVQFPYDEYGICLRNSAYGLQGHSLGGFDNWFSECMGAAIRSELWACLAPGQPERAAAFAWSDAVCDHSGDGIWAEIFLAALESAAFVETDRERLIDNALGVLPSCSRVYRAIADTRKMWNQTHQWDLVRHEIMASYGQDNFTDVAANLAFIVLGWLAGQGDFGKSILIATNCGQDTDCTAASLGALLGIIDPAGIPAEWKAPLGEGIILSPEIKGMTPPSNLRKLTARTLELQRQLADANPVIGEISRRQPATFTESPIRISVKVSWTCDTSVFHSDKAPETGFSPAVIELPGHWIEREAGDFTAPVQLLQFRFRLDSPQSIRLCGWSQSQTAIWVNGEKPVPAIADLACSYSALGAPSFHRGGPGHFDVEKPLPAGEYDFVVAWEMPKDRADLVVGIANLQSKQWLPFALAKITNVIH